MQEKMFRIISVENYWQRAGEAIIEWWVREDDTIKITRETVPFRDFMNLTYLYREIKLNGIRKFNDD